MVPITNYKLANKVVINYKQSKSALKEVTTK